MIREEGKNTEKRGRRKQEIKKKNDEKIQAIMYLTQVSEFRSIHSFPAYIFSHIEDITECHYYICYITT